MYHDLIEIHSEDGGDGSEISRKDERAGQEEISAEREEAGEGGRRGRSEGEEEAQGRSEGERENIRMHRVQVQDSLEEQSHKAHAHPHRRQAIRMHQVQLQDSLEEHSHKAHAQQTQEHPCCH